MRESSSVGSESRDGHKHCCREMESRLDYKCDQHHGLFDCPDHLIHYCPRFDEYGIIVHDDEIPWRSWVWRRRCEVVTAYRTTRVETYWRADL